MSDELFKNLIKKAKTFFSKSRYQDDEVPEFKDEYSLLVQNNRVIDYTLLNSKMGVNLNIGLYRDTNKYITKGVSKEQAIENIGSVLSAVKPVYSSILKEKFNLQEADFENESNLINKVERTSRLFKVNNIKLGDNQDFVVLCLHLLIRPDSKPFIIIGKEPKGKRKPTVEKGFKPEPKNNWDTIDFK